MTNAVLAIVVTYNGKDWLDYCFGSLLDSTSSVDILCIDNNSSDGTAEAVRDAYPQATLITNKQNLGFGRANNQGLEICIKEGYEYAFLLNQDARVEPNTIRQLVDAQQANPEYGILSPIHRAENNDCLDYNFSTYVSPKSTPQLIDDCLLGNTIKDVYSVEFVNAALWLISRDCLQSVGTFDPLFTHYGEDVDYTERVKAAGMKLGIVPTALANHVRYTPQEDNSDAKLAGEHQKILANFLLRFKHYKGSKLMARIYFLREFVANTVRSAIFLDLGYLRKYTLPYLQIIFGKH